MIISCSNYEINDIINKIKSKFKIFNYGPIKYLLGITIEQTKFEYRISQTNFIENLLSYNIKITQNKRTNIPWTLNNITNDKPFNPTTYKSVIGSLIYLAKCTRPDISFAVHHTARQCENPTYADWYKIIYILKYLNNTKYFKILYYGLGPFHGYTDADWGQGKPEINIRSYILNGKLAHFMVFQETNNSSYFHCRGRIHYCLRMHQEGSVI